MGTSRRAGVAQNSVMDYDRTDDYGRTDYERMVEELQQEVTAREREIYSDVVLREAKHPQNMGPLRDEDAHGLVKGWCGDTMEIYLRLHEGTIEEATFTTDGCGATVACGSMLTQMVTGMKLDRAEWILPKDLINALDGLPDESLHCAGLAISTLQNALLNWRVCEMEEEGEASEDG